MHRLICFCCLLACLFMPASPAVAQEQLPDLTPVVINASEGRVEVRNVGHAVANPSQAYVVCSIVHAGRASPCAKGMHLPGYIEKWNVLPVDVPALKPGESYPIQLFGAGAFQKKSENNYGINISTDARKRIAESNEANNDTHLSLVAESATKKIEMGQLQIQVLMHGVPIKAAVTLTAPGKTAHEMVLIQRRNRMKQTPFEESWPVGKYDLHIHSEVSSPVNIYMLSKAIPVEIKKGQRLEKTVTIPSGRLQLDTTVEGETTAGTKVKISTLQGDFKYFYGLGLLTAPLDVTFPAGQYKLEAKSEEQQQTRFVIVDIKAGSTTKKLLNFDKLRVGYLKLNLLMDGEPIPFEYGFNATRRDLLADVRLVSSETAEPFEPLEAVRDKPIKLREGVYDLKVHERTVGGKDVEVKRIAIREGHTTDKTVEIRQPGTLNIKARWTGQPYNVAACVAYHNPINLNRLGALMGGGSGAGGRSRGKCLDPNVFLRASISSPGRSDGDIGKDIYLKSRGYDDDERMQSINIEPGVYDLTVWPILQGDHRELAQTLRTIEITAGGITKKKLEFRWPGKK